MVGYPARSKQSLSAIGRPYSGGFAPVPNFRGSASASQSTASASNERYTLRLALLFARASACSAAARGRYPRARSPREELAPDRLWRLASAAF